MSSICILISHERSGSHLLKSLLESSEECSVTGEFFHVNEIESELGFYNWLSKQDDLKLLSIPNEDNITITINRYFEYLLAKYNNPKKLIIDIKYGQLHSLSGCWYCTRHSSLVLNILKNMNIQIIHCFRDNVFNAVCSNSLAHHTSIWHKKNAKKYCNASILLNFKSVFFQCMGLAMEIYQWRTHINNLEKNMSIEIKYENIEQDAVERNNEIIKIYKFLNVDYKVKIETDLIKVSGNPSEYVQNYDDLQSIEYLFKNSQLLFPYIELNIENIISNIKKHEDGIMSNINIDIDKRNIDTQDSFSMLLKKPPLLHCWDGINWNMGGFLQKDLINFRNILNNICNPKIIETGAGLSTLAFLACKVENVTSIAPDSELYSRILLRAQEYYISTKKLTFICENSETALPKLALFQNMNFDFGLIDGSHGWPTPFVDLCYIHYMLNNGGYLVIDDLQLYSCGEIYRFLEKEPMYELIDNFEKYAIFKKKNNQKFFSGHGAQKYIVENSNHTYKKNFEICDNHADILRDSALDLEHTDLHKAYELMKLAHLVRPTGPFIQKKIEEYEHKLNITY